MAKSNRITVEKLNAEASQRGLGICPEFDKRIEFIRLFDASDMSGRARYLATTDIMIETKKELSNLMTDIKRMKVDQLIREAKRRGIRKRCYALGKAELIELLSYFFEVVQETLDWTMGDDGGTLQRVNVKDMTVKQLRDICGESVDPNELLKNKISILVWTMRKEGGTLHRVIVEYMTFKQLRYINARSVDPNELLEKKISILLNNDVIGSIK